MEPASPDCGWLIELPICGVSSACTMSGSVKATMANDSLSLVIFFICFLFFCCLTEKSFCGLRQPAAGGLQRRKLPAACDPNGERKAPGDAFRMIINDKRALKTVGLAG